MKNIHYSKLNIMLLLLWLPYVAQAQKIKSISLESEKLVTNEGLYFEGAKDVTYHFGKRISPHGDCIKVIGGYVFVTWYKGGMDKMDMMLSRKPVEGGEWVTIQFPDKHIGYRGNPSIGDSHNTIAVGVCPIDSTIHLIYDMHAYSKASYPTHYFNYRVTHKGKAFVPDDEFTLAIFNDKQFYLKPGVNYERSTYPGFNLFDDGRLMVDFRFGGSGNGDTQYNIYDGKQWMSPIQFNKGYQGNPEKTYSIYGGFKFLQGKLRAGFSIRYSAANQDDSFKYDVNNGLFYCIAEQPFGQQNWTDALGKTVSIPLQNPDVVKVGEPCEIGIGNRTTSGPKWTITANEAVHFMTVVSGTPVHYFKTKDQQEFAYSTDCPNPSGDLFAVGENILLVYLDGDRVAFQSSPEGKNSWSTLYRQTTGSSLRHCNVCFDGERIYVYAMKRGSGQAQPITLQTYKVEFEAESTIHIEAEDYDEGGEGIAYHDADAGNLNGAYRTDDVDILKNAKASNGFCISNFKTGEWMQYTFEVGTEGEYQLQYYASNLYDGNAAVDVHINDSLVASQAPVERSNSWDIFASNLLLDTIFLSKGKHVMRITQKKTGSHNPDRLVFTKLTPKPEPKDSTLIPYSIEWVEAQQEPNIAENLHDGNTHDESRWSANEFPKSIIFDLEKVHHIVSTRMFTYQQRAYQYRIEVSNHPDKDFETIIDRSQNTESSQPLIDSLNAQGRYVKLTITGAHGYDSNWVSINEFVINGSPATDVGVPHHNLTSNMQVYPIPTTSGINIKLKESRMDSIQLYALDGTLIYEQTAEGSSHFMLLPASTKAGLYILVVKDNKQQVHRKSIIIQ